jgi:hypothetical protein
VVVQVLDGTLQPQQQHYEHCCVRRMTRVIYQVLQDSVWLLLMKSICDL